MDEGGVDMWGCAVHENMVGVRGGQGFGMGMDVWRGYGV